MAPGTWFRINGRRYRVTKYGAVCDMSPAASADFQRRGWRGLGICEGVRGAIKRFWVRDEDGSIVLD